MMTYKLLYFQILSILLAGSAAVDSQAARVVDCSSCHGRISSEWRSSSHARSYTSPLFLHELEKSDDSPQSSCACHAPDFFVTAGIGSPPEKRTDSLHLGVDCLSCHMDREMVAYAAGGELTVPHWVSSEERYTQSVFCATCHKWAKDLAVDCRVCHMPEVKGPATDHPIFGRPAASRHSSHGMLGLNDVDFVAGAASLEVETAAGQLRISLTNLNSVHDFPQIRRRRAELSLAGDSAGDALWTENVRLAADSTAGYTVDLPRGGKDLAVELRLYPAPELWPDSSLLLVKETIERE